MTLTQVKYFCREGLISPIVKCYDQGDFVSIFHKGKSFTVGENCDIELSEETIKRIFERVLEVPYDDFVSDKLRNLLATPFPFPQYQELELYRDYASIRKAKSLKANSGLRVVNHFHPSIFKANTKGKPSPFEAWQDKDAIERCIHNRIIYANNLDPSTIMRGLTTSLIAPKISVFSPSTAFILARKYLQGCQTIVDPCSGFSGRLLGVSSALPGSKYIGFDINPVTVKESQTLIQSLKISNVEVTCLDSTGISYSADALFTCPPYGDTENWNQEIQNHSVEDWIEICLSRFHCKRYLIVIPSWVTEFDSFCVETISNRNHLNSKSGEKVILIENDKNLLFKSIIGDT